jgi:hypothetical protein
MSSRRRRVWSPQAIPFGAVILVLGLWAAAVPLVGPYFDFGFDTDRTWVFSQPHWTLSIVAGLAAAVGGFLLATPTRGFAGLGGLLVTVAGLWLLIGPSLYPLWADEGLRPLAGSDTKHALLWIGYFYGAGALIVFLAGYAEGLVTRRKRVEETQVAEPQFERVVTEG